MKDACRVDRVGFHSALHQTPLLGCDGQSLSQLVDSTAKRVKSVKLETGCGLARSRVLDCTQGEKDPSSFPNIALYPILDVYNLP